MIPHIWSIEAFRYIKLSDGYFNFGIIFFFCFFHFINVQNVTIFLKGKSKQHTMLRTALAAALFCRYQFPGLLIFEFFHLFNYFFHILPWTQQPPPLLYLLLSLSLGATVPVTLLKGCGDISNVSGKSILQQTEGKHRMSLSNKYEACQR